jgi:formate-dependent phosphoribosylglycinamide formyltransferase (GAR transformylase)
METPILRILLTGTNRWALAARLAISLNEAGCEIFAICPPGSSAIGKTSVVRQFFRYNGLRPLQSLETAIESVHPDLVIPTCDRGVEHLRELYDRAQSRGAKGEAIAKLIESSIGPASAYSLISSRYDLLAVAQETGVRVPRFSRLSNAEDLAEWQSKEPFPWVMKADGTWGGQGVRIIRSTESAAVSLEQLPQMFRFSRAIKRLIVNRDSFWIRPWWKGIKRAVTVQSFIDGYPANCTAVCWRGKVLAFIAVEVVQSDGSTGPASIVRTVEGAEMRFAADRIAERLQLSGFFGLDFMVENRTNAAYLIELNPRPTPPCHLRLGKGRDLPGALWSQLSGQPLPDHPPVTTNPMIAYLPAALKASQDCYRDFPQGEPELLQELLNPFPDRTIPYRLVQLFSRKPSDHHPDIRTSSTKDSLMKPQPTRSAER